GLWGSPADPAAGGTCVVYANSATVAVQEDEVPSAQGAPLCLGDLLPTGNTAPVVDSATHELFIPGQFTHTDASSYPSDDAIAVYRDTRPPVVPAPSVDPDSQTHDIDVSADTPVTYGAFASGYGARATIVGGLHSTALG